MVLLENDVFLTELTRMFQKHKTKGTGAVSLTMKRYDCRTKPQPRAGRPPLPDPTEYKCLLRAALGNSKISTVISQKDVNKFHLAYASLLKGNLDGLKKREKKTMKKQKAS